MNQEYIEKARSLVQVTLWLTTSQVLDLDEDIYINIFKELLVMAQWLSDRDTMMLVCSELGLLYNKLNLYNDAIKYQQIHLCLAIETNNKDSQVKAYDNLGYTHLMLHQPWDALSNYEKERVISMEIGNKKGELDSCEMLAAINLALGNHDDAVKFYEQQLAVAKETGDNIEQKSAYINMIKAYEKMENIPHDKITKCYEEWLNVPSEDEKQERGSVYGRLGNIYQQLNNFDQAIKCYQKSLEIAIQQSNSKLEAMLYLNLGLAYFSQEKFQEAGDSYEKALQLAIKLDDKDLQGKSYDKLGRLYAQHTKDYAKAIQYCERALQIAEALDDIVGQLDCFEMLGCIHLKLGNNDDSIKNFKQQLNIAQKSNNIIIQKMVYLNMADAYKNLKDFPHLANCLEEWLKMTSCKDNQKKKDVYLILGNANQEMENTTEAITCYENALEITQQLPDQKLEILLNINLGYTYFSRGDLQEADDYYGKGLELAIKFDNKTLQGKAYDKLGHLSLKTEDYSKAIEHFQKALEVAVDDNKEDDEATACENLGDVNQRTRDYKRALKWHQRQLQICAEMGYKDGQARAYKKLGVSHEKLGNYPLAIKNKAKDLEMRVENDDKKGEAEALSNLGNTYKMVGQFHEALDNYKESLDIAKQIGDQALEQRAHHGVGNILFLLHNFEEAAGYFEESLNIALKMDEKELVALAYARLGLCQMKFNKYKEALGLFDNQIRLAKEIEDRELEADGYHNKGIVCSILQDDQEAINLLQKHLKISEETESKDLEARGHNYLSRGEVFISIADIHGKKGEREENEQCIAKSISSLNEALRWHEVHFRHLHGQDYLNISYLDTFFEKYNYLTLMLLASEQNKEALLACERGRARALSELLVAKYNMDHDNQLGSGFISYAEIENMAASCSILFYFRQSSSMCTWVIAPESPITQSKYDSEDSFSKLIEDNIYGALRGKQLQCEDRSVQAWDQQEKQNLPQRHPFNATDIASEKLISSAREMFKKRCIPDEDLYDDEDNQNPLECLYKSLISPVFQDLTKEELVIIPDGDLLMVPFAALRDPDTGVFLSEIKQIRLAPSLTSLKVLRESPADFHNKTGALIVGNPKVGKVTFRENHIVINNLDYAEREAEMIGDLLNVKPLLGAEATKKAVIESLREGVAIVHFAAHGTTDGKIYLAPSTTNDWPNEQEYLLTMKDVQESGVRPQLVVLSCCHSGRGEIKAEGVVGMSRAFLAAGAASVVASLWAITDEATMVFMERFYSHLNQGESASKSLQQAMKEMREISRFSDPQFWAPFFLIGNDVTINMMDKQRLWFTL